MPAPSEEAIRRTTEEVLARPEFHRAAGGDGRSLRERVIEFLAGLADRAPVFDSPFLSHLAIGMLAALALFGTLYLVRTIASGVGRARGGAGGDRGSRSMARAEILGGVAGDWNQALEGAREALGQGDLRSAVWIAHRVLLGLLDEAGAVRFAPGKTNGNYLRDCPGNHPWRGTLEALSAAYERVVYGHREGRAEALDHLLGQVAGYLSKAGVDGR